MVQLKPQSQAGARKGWCRWMVTGFSYYIHSGPEWPSSLGLSFPFHEECWLGEQKKVEKYGIQMRYVGVFLPHMERLMAYPKRRHIPPTTTASPESRTCLSPQPSVFIKDTRTLTSMVALSNDMQSDGQRTARDVPQTGLEKWMMKTMGNG